MASGKGANNGIGFLSIIFQAVQTTDYIGLVRNDTAPLTNIYISLHTASPTSAGNQTSSEADYTSYARVPVARTTGGWSISSSTISNVASITFPLATGGSESEAYVGIGTLASGTGVLLWFGQLTAPLAVSSGITPSFAISALTVTEA